MTLPELPPVQVIIEETIIEEYDIVESDALAMEDDIEKEIAELKKDEPKKTSRNEKIKMLLAQKAIELTKKAEDSVSIEQQMLVQRQLLLVHMSRI